jgi:hypothetical protein
MGGKLVATNWVGDQSLLFLGVPVALIAVIIAYLWQDMGYNLVIFIAALQSIPESLKDAARIDGVNSWQMFRYNPLLEEEGKNPMVMDMKEPDWDLFQQFLDNEVRFASLKKSFPEEAERLQKQALSDAKWRYYHLKQLAAMEAIKID